MNDILNRHAVGKRRACKIIGINRSTESRRSSRAAVLQAVVGKIVELSERYPRWGYRKIYDRLKTDGTCIARETVRLLRKQEGLQVEKKQRRKRHLEATSQRELEACYPNYVWSYDFVEDATADGRRLRFLNVVDEHTRECLAISCSRTQNWQKVKQVLQRLVGFHGVLDFLRSDNGSEFIAKKLKEWLKEMKVQTAYIEPGSPWQNPYVESFNSVFRDGCLNRWLFFSPREAQSIADTWRNEYNLERPHGSLGGSTPAAFAHGYAMSKHAEVA
ncbi:MAG: IS3 family transposase [bacterium]|nr:IS3 family transposase [bacterium]